MTENHEASIRQKAMESGFRALFKSINLFGCEATLVLMVRLAHKDSVVNDLLNVFPATVVMRDFLSRAPVIRVPKSGTPELGRGPRKELTQDDNQRCTSK